MEHAFFQDMSASVEEVEQIERAMYYNRMVADPIERCMRFMRFNFTGMPTYVMTAGDWRGSMIQDVVRVYPCLVFPQWSGCTQVDSPVSMERGRSLERVLLPVQAPMKMIGMGAQLLLQKHSPALHEALLRLDFIPLGATSSSS